MEAPTKNEINKQDIVYIILYITFLITFGLSNWIHKDPNPMNAYSPIKQQFDTKGRLDMKGKKKYSSILEHVEINGTFYERLTSTGVCTAGRMVFYLWAIVLLIFILIKFLDKESYNKIKPYEYVLNILAIITALFTLALNQMLFVRSIPAYVLLFLFINYDQIFSKLF